MAIGVSKKQACLSDTKEASRIEQPSLSYSIKKPVASIIDGEKAILKEVWTSGASTNNTLIWGDNLPIMRTLLSNSELVGKIRLIYIDPPYATNTVFKSLDQRNAYPDLLQGAEYVEFLRERLILLRELLADDGSIYVHLDGKMVFEAKLLLDEIFGKSLFQNMITRKKCSTKNTTSKRYGNISDYILFYSKRQKFVWNRSFDSWPTEKIVKEYPCVDEKTGRRYKKVPIHAPGTRNGETGKPWHGKLPPKGKHWQVTPAKLDALDAAGDIYWSATGNPRRKVYFDSSKGIPKQDIWLNRRDSVNQNIMGTGYPTEKNFDMLEEIILASSNESDIVLDAFCGSGTTLHAAEKNGRRWIGIDSQEESISCTLKRFTTGAETMGNYVDTNSATMTRGHQNLSIAEKITADFSLRADSDHFARALEIFNPEL